MLVFGGRGAQLVFQDLWSFELPSAASTTGVWSQLSAANPPPPRTGHAAAVLGDKDMLLVGGSGLLGKDTIDVWVFDSACKAWSQVDMSSSPSMPAGRHGHLLQPVGGAADGQYTFIMYGGQSGTGDNDPFLGDVWNLTVSAPSGMCGKASLRSSTTIAAVATGSWVAQGQGPPPRAHMADAVIGGAGDLVLFGGFAGYSGGLNDHLLSDSWMLHTQ